MHALAVNAVRFRIGARVATRVSPMGLRIAPSRPRGPRAAPDDVLSVALRQHERELLAAALREARGNVTACARALRLPLRTLVAKIAAHGLQGHVAAVREARRGRGDGGASPFDGPTAPGAP